MPADGRYARARALCPRMGAAIDFHQPFGIDRGVDLRGRQRGVAEQFLDRAQVAAAGEKMRGERMAQRMWGRSLGQSERAAQARHRKLDDAIVPLQQSTVAADVAGDLSEIRCVPVLLPAERVSSRWTVARSERVQVIGKIERLGADLDRFALVDGEIPGQCEIELEYSGEEKTGEELIERLLNRAVLKVFDKWLKADLLKDVTEYFEKGWGVEASDMMKAEEYLEGVKARPLFERLGFTILP